MKATHTGRLKNIGELVEIIKKDDSFQEIGKEYLCFLYENEGGKLEVHKEYDNNYVHGSDVWLIEEMFSSIKPIKHKIEIPETPFWFKDEVDSLCKINFIKDGICGGYNIGADCTFSMSSEEALHYLNKETPWKIVPEPVKEMRPWGYDEFLAYWEDNGFCIPVRHIENTNGWFGAFHNLSKTGVYIPRNDQMLFDDFCETYMDINGNKFEKEL